MARPTKYTEKLGIFICNQIANGKSLKKVCEMKDMPHRTTVHSWLLDNEKEEFYYNYEKAVNVRTDNMFDDIEDIANNEKGEVQRDRLKVDVRKWYLSKVMPKKYGDKIDITSDNKPIPIMSVNVLPDNSNGKDSEDEEEG